jgi:hypothetical protein
MLNFGFVKRHIILLLLFLLHFFADAQKESHLVARYSFNSGQPVNDLGKHHPKVYGALLAADRFGNPNSAYFLNGNYTSFINLGTGNELKQRAATISMWFKMDFEIYAGKGVQINPILFTRCCNDSDFNDGYNIIYRLEVKKLSACNAISPEKQVAITATETLSLRAWHHAVLCYDEKVLSFYLDGKEIGTVNKNFANRFLEGDSVIVGYRLKDKNERFFAGSVDDIEFYDKVLSKAEIMELYHAPNPNRYASLRKWIFISLFILLAAVVFTYFLRKRIRYLINKEKERSRIVNNALEQEVKMLKAQMNPHFIFNSLNSILQFIIIKQNEKAELYLTKFSKLIRKILESNLQENISLADELLLLRGYLEMESLRFNEIFNPFIEVDPTIDPQDLYIPQMLIQPFVENAIWHGLRMKNGKKELKISFTLINQYTLKCIIDDNGVGRGNGPSPEGQNKNRSLATGFIRQRLELMSKKYEKEYKLSIYDKTDSNARSTGTLVELTMPVLNKLNHVEYYSDR